VKVFWTLAVIIVVFGVIVLIALLHAVNMLSVT
jgi:hypothetical protein